MNCPLCSCDTFVLKSAAGERRRQCTGCRHRFVTLEVLKDEKVRKDALLADAKALAERIAEGA